MGPAAAFSKNQGAQPLKASGSSVLIATARRARRTPPVNLPGHSRQVPAGRPEETVSDLRLALRRKGAEVVAEVAKTRRGPGAPGPQPRQRASAPEPRAVPLPQFGGLARLGAAAGAGAAASADEPCAGESPPPACGRRPSRTDPR